MSIDRTYTAVCLFGGGGLLSLGLEASRPGWRGITGRIDVVASVDSWPVASRVHDYLCPGSRAVTMDLFTAGDYAAYHGGPPPEGWAEAAPEDLRALCPEGPDILATSPPCKGFSSNLSAKKAGTAKYQALGRLTLRGLWLALEAWADCPPRLILFENVPRIRNRGAELLEEIRALLASRGYAVDDRDHDAGELGGLAQTRKRFLLAARLKTGAPFPVHLPKVQPLKGIGEVVGQLPIPLPGTPLPPMHEVPKGMHWLTSLRLALIPPGRDWRALREVEAYVVAWHPGRGFWMVATLREGEPWRAPSEWAEGIYVGSWEREEGGLLASWMEDRGWTQLGYRLRGWEETAGTVGSHGGSATGSAATFVADPRLGCAPRAGAYGVMGWEGTSPTVAASVDIHAGTAAVADPRLGGGRDGEEDPLVRKQLRSELQDALQEAQHPVPDAGHLPALPARAPGAEGPEGPALPRPRDRGPWVILSPWDAWHRPCTTAEVALLQGLPRELRGEPLDFYALGLSDADAREIIGNGVPPPAARAIGEEYGQALLEADGVVPTRLLLGGKWVINQEEVSDA